MEDKRYTLAFALTEVVAIVDNCSEKRPSRTVTNAADEIVAKLLASGLLDGRKRLIYRDTEGFWDEIVYQPDRGFVRFAPLRTQRLDLALDRVGVPLR